MKSNALPGALAMISEVVRLRNPVSLAQCAGSRSPPLSTKVMVKGSTTTKVKSPPSILPRLSLRGGPGLFPSLCHAARPRFGQHTFILDAACPVVPGSEGGAVLNQWVRFSLEATETGPFGHRAQSMFSRGRRGLITPHKAARFSHLSSELGPRQVEQSIVMHHSKHPSRAHNGESRTPPGCRDTRWAKPC